MEPKTRIEYFLNKIAENGSEGGDGGSGGIFVVHMALTESIDSYYRYDCDCTKEEFIQAFKTMPVVIMQTNDNPNASFLGAHYNVHMVIDQTSLLKVYSFTVNTASSNDNQASKVEFDFHTDEEFLYTYLYPTTS